jgi:hypothetical protein
MRGTVTLQGMHRGTEWKQRKGDVEWEPMKGRTDRGDKTERGRGLSKKILTYLGGLWVDRKWRERN